MLIVVPLGVNDISRGGGDGSISGDDDGDE